MDKTQERKLELLGFSVETIKGMKTIPRVTMYTPDGRKMDNLPADPYHLPRYMKRGFTVNPPSTKPQMESPDGFPCETCGKVLSTKLALAGHSRSHKET